MSAPDRRAKLDRDHPKLSVRRQCTMLGIARSGVYRLPWPANDGALALLRRIDELFPRWPFLGSRRLTAMLRADGEAINRKRVQRLMRRMGIAALGPKPRTSKPAPGHMIYPYLLRGLAVERPNQVWAADITYVPIGRGFLYLVAVIDWASRAVLAWRLSNTMDVSFCVSALEEALARFGRPEIFNTDQGSQFTSAAFTDARCGRRPHLDGRAWSVDGQRVHRAAVAFLEVRGHLPQGLCRRPRGARRDRCVDCVLQPPPPAPGARQPAANGGLACGRHRCARRHRCGHDAALGQRSRVAHMPTAATAAARGFNRVRDSGGRNGRASN